MFNQVYSFIKKNDRVLKVTKDGFINSFYEQMFFYTMAREENKSVNYCTRGDKLSTKFDWLDCLILHVNQNTGICIYSLL